MKMSLNSIHKNIPMINNQSIHIKLFDRICHLNLNDSFIIMNVVKQVVKQVII